MDADRKSGGDGNRGSRASVAVRRQRVIDAAIVEFTTHGYMGASMDSVARRSGVAKPTLYQWYGNKQQLFETAVADNFLYIGEELNSLLIATEPPRTVLLKVADRLLATHLRQENLELLRLSLAEARRFPELAEKVRAGADKGFFQLLEGYIQQMIERGIFRSVDHRRAARLFPLMVVGGYDFLMSPPSSENLFEEYCVPAVDMFLHGMLA